MMPRLDFLLSWNPKLASFSYEVARRFEEGLEGIPSESQTAKVG